jgi:hypothetical protein
MKSIGKTRGSHRKNRKNRKKTKHRWNIMIHGVSSICFVLGTFRGNFDPSNRDVDHVRLMRVVDNDLTCTDAGIILRLLRQYCPLKTCSYLIMCENNVFNGDIEGC